MTVCSDWRNRSAAPYPDRHKHYGSVCVTGLTYVCPWSLIASGSLVILNSGFYPSARARDPPDRAQRGQSPRPPRIRGTLCFSYGGPTHWSPDRQAEVGNRGGLLETAGGRSAKNQKYDMISARIQVDDDGFSIAQSFLLAHRFFGLVRGGSCGLPGEPVTGTPTDGLRGPPYKPILFAGPFYAAEVRAAGHVP